MKALILNHYKTICIVLCILSLMSYFLSLYFPVSGLKELDRGENYEGLMMVLFGGLSLLVYDFWSFILWLINPLYIFSFIVLSYTTLFKKMWIMIFMLPVIGATFLFKPTICVTEGGAFAPIIHIYIGYYLWEFALILLALAGFVKFLFEKN